MQEATDERERNEGIFFCLISKTALLVLSRHYLDHCTCTKYVTVNLRCYVLVQVSKWAMALISSLILQVGFHPWDDLLDLRQCHIMQDSTYSQRGCLHLWTESLKHLDLLLYWDLVGYGGLDVQYRLHRLKSFSSWKILIEGTWLLIISVSVSSRYLYRCIWTLIEGNLVPETLTNCLSVHTYEEWSSEKLKIVIPCLDLALKLKNLEVQAILSFFLSLIRNRGISALSHTH